MTVKLFWVIFSLMIKLNGGLMEGFTNTLVEFYEKLSSWEHDVVKGSGISLPQMHTIEVLGNSRGIRMKELSEKLGISTGTLTVMIKRLEKAGYVLRKRDPDDGRSFRLDFTPTGEKIYNEHHLLHIRLSEHIVEILTKEEEDQFIRILKKVNENF